MRRDVGWRRRDVDARLVSRFVASRRSQGKKTKVEINFWGHATSIRGLHGTPVVEKGFSLCISLLSSLHLTFSAIPEYFIASSFTFCVVQGCTCTEARTEALETKWQARACPLAREPFFWKRARLEEGGWAKEGNRDEENRKDKNFMQKKNKKQDGGTGGVNHWRERMSLYEMFFVKLRCCIISPLDGSVSIFFLPQQTVLVIMLSFKKVRFKRSKLALLIS